MNRILQTGRTGLGSIQRKMDAIAHNIANIQTIGYKSLEAQFEDLVYDQVADRGVPLTLEAREKPIAIGTGSRVKSIGHRFKQGNLQETTNPLDLAIEGEGFFGVENEYGEIFLTRDGAFKLDSNGRLVDSRGNYVSMVDVSTGAHINPPYIPCQEEDITIDKNGFVTAFNEAGESVEVGRIVLFNINDKNMLVSEGDNYYSAGNADLFVIGNEAGSSIHQGFLESSAVDIGEELIDMFITQRAYQINIKSINAADEMWSMVNQMRR